MDVYQKLENMNHARRYYSHRVSHSQVCDAVRMVLMEPEMRIYLRQVMLETQVPEPWSN